MSAKRLILILALSIATGTFAQWIARDRERLQIEQLTAIACDMVSARAQAGSTRDVHDQLYSFWHKHSPNLHVDVLVKRGEKEVGAQSSIEQANAYTQTCHVQNMPDYEISFQFEEYKIFEASLIEKIALAFIVFLTIGILATLFIRTIRELWSVQVVSEIRKSLGLSNNSFSKANLMSRFLARIFVNSASSLRPAIEDLQTSLVEKQSELTQTKTLILDLEEERIKANQFANLVTMVRHDLKGPLSALKITAGGIQGLKEESDSLKQTIVSIEKIISDLDQKKKTTDAVSLKGLTFEIAEVVIQAAVDEKSGVLSSKNGIQIEFEYNTGTLSPVMCEPNHLRRMINNLLQNAIEASPKGARVKVGVRQENGSVLVEIADQGNGIAPEFLPRLFEQGATFGKANGTGQGLAFVKSKAESFGGEIRVAESSNTGTVFQLKIPLADTKAIFQALPSDAALKRMAILDDEIEFQKFAWANTPGDREYFGNPQTLFDWIEKTPRSSEFSYLIDLHLRDTINGLDVIRTLGSGKIAYLATSDYLNPDAIELSGSLGIAILPKTLLFSACR